MLILSAKRPNRLYCVDEVLGFLRFVAGRYLNPEAEVEIDLYVIHILSYFFFSHDDKPYELFSTLPNNLQKEMIRNLLDWRPHLVLDEKR